MAREFEWSSEMGSRRRRAWLLLVDGEGTVHVFDGESIEGVVAVVAWDYEKRGKWSHYIYRLRIAPGVRPISGLDGWETARFIEGLHQATHAPTDTWVDVANALGTSIEKAKEFLRSFRPKEAEWLDEVDARLAAIERIEAEAETTYDIVRYTIPSPRRKERSDHWSWPIVVNKDGQIVGTVRPASPDWQGWRRPVAEGEVQVLAVESSRGNHCLKLGVPDGATVYRAPQHGRTEDVE